ncbi:hypothetical protein GF312_18625 [Candidatus Poribacteria bacterium]|nr:hypothetical protein [Candidatus Poribacteria bacterium]
MQKFTYFLTAIIIVLIFSISFMASGRPFRVALLPDQGENFSCGTCHTNPAGGGNRNSFGTDWENFAIPAGDVYTDELGSFDSDGDGFTNDEEFAAGKHPGDPESKPEKAEPVEPKKKKFTVWGKIRVGISD